MEQAEIQARIAASNAKKGPKAPPIDNTELVEAFRKEGGGILHLPPSNLQPRGGTVAYKVRGSRLEVATSLTHPNDVFSRKMGTKTAIEHFREGRTIFLPMTKKIIRRHGKTVSGFKIDARFAFKHL